MPQPAEQHLQEEVDIGAARAFPIATQADVKVVAKLEAEADVPASPELAGRPGHIRNAEVEVQLTPEKTPDAARDVGLA
jgi:hypothetical protein